MDKLLTTPPHFRTKRIITKSGEAGEKVRTIHVPDNEARTFHELFLARLYKIHPPFFMPSATGGIPGRSLVDNIKPHAGSRNFYMLDIKDAYASLDGERLAGILYNIGYWCKIFETEKEAQGLLDEFCLDPETKGLIIGAPSSPYLFNIYCEQMDMNIRDICAEAGLTYTRYLDDLTISTSSKKTITKKQRRAIRGSIINEGWNINHQKSRVHSLDKAPVTVTGISLYPDGYWKLSPELIEKIRLVFDELEAKMNTQHGYFSDEDRGRLHGYYGILVSTYDDRRGHPTRIERQLRQRYMDLRHQLRQYDRRLGKPAAQMSLIHPYSYRMSGRALRELYKDPPKTPRGKQNKSKPLTLDDLDPAFLDKQADEY